MVNDGLGPTGPGMTDPSAMGKSGISEHFAVLIDDATENTACIVGHRTAADGVHGDELAVEVARSGRGGT